ncbi:MAG: CerR family C-terminal domain-containing protein [Kiritimatiellae bacterium]|nr:CerR family C-terminal domain-containing protein [Kiritimatiellia bacterium]
MKPKTKTTRARPAKEQILRVAKELFAERGFRDTTIREIAKRAGVNGAAVNYYFDTKEALYVAIFEEAFERFRDPLSRLPAQVHDQASWRAALEAWFDFVLELFLLDTPERSIFRRLVAQERAAPGAATARILENVIRPVAGILRDLIGMSMPDAPPAAVHAAFITTMSQCAVFMHRDPPWDRFLFAPGVPRETWLRTVRDEIVGNVCARRSFVRRPAP